MKYVYIRIEVFIAESITKNDRLTQGEKEYEK